MCGGENSADSGKIWNKKTARATFFMTRAGYAKQDINLTWPDRTTQEIQSFAIY